MTKAAVSAHPAHPTTEALRQFGGGELSGPEADVVEAHVSTCTDCCTALRGLPDDPVIELLRQAKGSAVLDPEGKESAAAADELPAELRDHPRYLVLALLGRGGMGAVFRAEHRLMRRPVALKVISRQLTARPELAERFRREARAAARLDHPHIVRVFDAEQAGGTHFLVMEFIPGTDLARLVAERGPLPVAEACEYARQVALGLQHAFEHGMVHRDVKPANLMRTEAGTIKILDFGVARFASEAGGTEGMTLESGTPDAPTGSGLLLGTVDYMAPEQAEDARRADVRSDLYSLGCTLYHLLAGGPPFPGGSLLHKVRAQAEREPEPIREHRPDVPEGLVAVLARLMAKDPAQRFQTPAEVAVALAPFAELPSAAILPLPRSARAPCADEVTATAETPLAAPLGSIRRPFRPRRRWAVALAGAALAALVAVAVYRIQTADGELIITTDDPNVEVVILQNGEVVRIVDLKSGKAVTLRPGKYDLGLKGQPDGFRLDVQKVTIYRGERALATVERVPKRPREGPAAAVDHPPGLVWQVWLGAGAIDKPAVSPDGRYIAVSVAWSGWGVLYETQTRKVLCRFPSGGLLAFTGDGKHLATNTADHRNVALHRVPDGERIKTFESGSPIRLSNLDASADGKHVLGMWSGHSAATVVWDVPTGEERLRRKWLAYFSLDGKVLVSYAPVGPELHLIDLKTHTRLHALPGDPSMDRTPTVLPGGRELVLCNGTTRMVELWDVKTAKKVRAFPLGPTWINDSYIRSAFSADGKRLLTAHDDGFVRLWDVASGKEVYRFPVRTLVRGLTFSADGRHAAAGTHHGWFYLWRLPGADAPPLKPAAPFVTHQSGTREHVWNSWIYHAAFSADGRHYLATGSSWDNQVRVWDTATGKLVRALPGLQWAEFTPDDKQILACGADNTLLLWDLATGREVRRFRGHSRHVTGFDVSADGQRFLSNSLDGTVRLWDLKTGKELGRLEGQSEKCLAVFSPNGQQALSCGADRIIRLWDLDPFREVHRWKMPEGEFPHALRFLPDGRRFVAVSLTAVRWYDASSAREVKSLPLDFAGAENRLWILSRDAAFLMLRPKSDRTLRVLELSSGREVARFPAPEAEFGTQPHSPFGVPALSPDRRRLVVPALHESDLLGRVYLYGLPASK